MGPIDEQRIQRERAKSDIGESFIGFTGTPAEATARLRDGFAVDAIRLIAIRSDRFNKPIKKCLRQERDNLPSAIGNFMRNRHLSSIHLRD